jgi:hypothetical protein
VLRRLVALTGVAAVLGAIAFVWWPNGDYEPIRPGERGTIGEVIRAVPQVPSGRPSFTAERAAEFGAIPTARELRAAGKLRDGESFTAPDPAGVTVPGDDFEGAGGPGSEEDPGVEVPLDSGDTSAPIAPAPTGTSAPAGSDPSPGTAPSGEPAPAGTSEPAPTSTAAPAPTTTVTPTPTSTATPTPSATPSPTGTPTPDTTGTATPDADAVTDGTALATPEAPTPEPTVPTPVPTP